MGVIGEGYERAIEHVSNRIRFKRAIHTFVGVQILGTYLVRLGTTLFVHRFLLCTQGTAVPSLYSLVQGYTFMQAALQCSSGNNFAITWNEKITRLVYGGLLDAQR